MNKSLRGRGRESSDNRRYGFRQMGPIEERRGSRADKKRAAGDRRLLKLITGRRQTEWTGATRCPNEDSDSHKGESLIDRKRALFFIFH